VIMIEESNLAAATAGITVASVMKASVYLA
jgi:hypothetical protein